MKIKVSEATPLQLDWLVAKCEGFHIDDEAEGGEFWMEHDDLRVGYSGEFDFSTDWAQGGPIIEREHIKTNWISYDGKHYWSAINDECFVRAGTCMVATTLLIAAMCCFVASKLGDEVEVPEELK